MPEAPGCSSTACTNYNTGVADNLDAEHAAQAILQNNKQPLQALVGKVTASRKVLAGSDRQGWRKEGQELLEWLNALAAEMAEVEKNVAVTKVTGRSTALAGSLIAGGGLVATVLTGGLAAPIAAGGFAMAGVGTLTALGGDVTKAGIVMARKHEMKRKCKSFDEKSKEVVDGLMGLAQAMQELCMAAEQSYEVANGKAPSSEKKKKVVRHVVMKSLEGVEDAVSLTKGASAITDLALFVDAATLTGSVAAGGAAGAVSLVGDVFLPGLGVALGVGFSIWGIIEGAHVLKNGGAQAALIHVKATEATAYYNRIDHLLTTLNL